GLLQQGAQGVESPRQRARGDGREEVGQRVVTLVVAVGDKHPVVLPHHLKAPRRRLQRQDLAQHIAPGKAVDHRGRLGKQIVCTQPEGKLPVLTEGVEKAAGKVVALPQGGELGSGVVRGKVGSRGGLGNVRRLVYLLRQRRGGDPGRRVGYSDLGGWSLVAPQKPPCSGGNDDGNNVDGDRGD